MAESNETKVLVINKHLGLGVLRYLLRDFKFRLFDQCLCDPCFYTRLPYNMKPFLQR